MKRLVYSSLFVASCSLMGCGGSSENVATPQSTANVQTNQSSQPNVVAAQSGVQPQVGNAVGTEPGEVVAVFLDSLRRGDENAANAVLTAQAQEELKKTDYVIQPPGTPQGTYQVGRIGFPYEEKNVALVECLWTEPTQAGLPPVNLEIVYEVHQESNGWRIAGMGVKVAGTEETMVLDFEDGKSLQAILDQATAPQQASQTPQPGLPNQPQTLPQAQLSQLPQESPSLRLPSLPQQATLPTPGSLPNATGLGSGQQIALPNIPNAPIQR